MKKIRAVFGYFIMSAALFLEVYPWTQGCPAQM